MSEAFDLQAAFNVVAGIAGGLGAFILKGVKDDLKQQRADHDTLAAKLPETYARRDDFNAGIARVEATLQRIEEKIDRKADK